MKEEFMSICQHAHCTIEFKPKREKQRFCSSTCRIKQWELDHPRQMDATRRIQAILSEAVSPKTTPVSILEQDKKRDGMAAAANSNAEILKIFRGQAYALSILLGAVTIDDVRKRVDIIGIPYTPGNWMGSVFLSSQWSCVGFKPATHAGSRGRIVRVWKLKG